MADGLAAAILGKMGGGKPKVETEPAEESSGDDMGLTAAAEEMMAAIKSSDTAGVVSALRSAFAILESQPHDEAGEE